MSYLQIEEIELPFQRKKSEPKDKSRKQEKKHKTPPRKRGLYQCICLRTMTSGVNSGWGADFGPKDKSRSVVQGIKSYLKVFFASKNTSQEQ